MFYENSNSKYNTNKRLLDHYLIILNNQKENTKIRIVDTYYESIKNGLINRLNELKKKIKDK